MVRYLILISPCPWPGGSPDPVEEDKIDFFKAD